MDYEESLARIATIFESARDTLLTAKPIAQEVEDEADEPEQQADAKGIIQEIDDIVHDFDEFIAILRDDEDQDQDDDDFPI